ncbi:MAG: hypothetical protein RI563_13365, partial [Thiohalophilus sp.]|uniref:hypothetical protein n=1 Tax=Thiohalophilus sp. TaxID=3028392 RepID=UPI002870218B
ALSTQHSALKKARKVKPDARAVQQRQSNPTQVVPVACGARSCCYFITNQVVIEAVTARWVNMMCD